jgi:hypothetical protein
MAAALDWYFKLDDLHGDADAQGHQNWFDVQSWKYGPGSMKALPGRRQEVTIVMVTGPARATLVSAMQTRRKFIQAKLEGVNYRAGGEYHPFVDLRVIGIKPGGYNRNMKVLEEVTFEANSPG